MRVAALDYGSVRVGVALADELGSMAHPRTAIDARDRVKLLAAILSLAKTEDIAKFVVGVPLDSSGGVGRAAQAAMDFAEQVADVTRCEVELCDERLTTVEAARKLHAGGTRAKKARQRIDSAAACVMLQAWLDGKRDRTA